MWANWAGDQVCEPAVLERPASVEAVADAVGQARAAGRTVRVAGAGHSFTDAVLTDGTLLDLSKLNRTLDADPESGLVRVEAGVTIHELNGRLAELGRAFPNLGDIDVQSIAGAISTGTHGTGATLQNISAAITEVELVTADGSLVSVDERSDSEAWRAARVGVGALGVITAVTIQTVPAFTLRRVDEVVPLADVLERLDLHVGSNDHFEFFVWPYDDRVVTRTTNRTTDPPAPPGHLTEYLRDIVLTNKALDLVCRVGRRFPKAIPRLNRFITGVAASPPRVDRSDRCFASPRQVRFTEMEYALPRAALPEVLAEVRDFVHREKLPINFPMEIRFVAPDDALLSPAHERETAYIAVHVYKGMEWERFMRGCEAVYDRFEGRPHWGKRHFQTAATLAGRYPAWDRFQAVRERLDPDGVFANEYVRRTLVGRDG